jgi:hypothetical protein
MPPPHGVPSPNRADLPSVTSCLCRTLVSLVLAGVTAMLPGPLAHAGQQPSASPPGRVFIFRNAIRDVEQFRGFAQQAARLKRYGEVQVDVGVLADKSWYELPPGGSPWHEFGTYNAATFKFFPHPKIAPHLPADWVAANRRLLLAKAAILREYGLKASFSSNDTHYLPESFFREYPHLRGPRVDHPRRTRREEFSYCVDHPETLEMIEWMTAELIRHVPEIRTIQAQNNDSGAGLCWAVGQYSGPNGPAFCKHRTTGERLRMLLETMQRGAASAGGDLTIRLSGTFPQKEENEFLPLLPPNTFLSRPWPLRRPPEGDPNIAWTGTMIHDAYPVLGLVDPLAIMAALEKTAPAQSADSAPWTIVISTSQPWYHRGTEPLAAVEKLVDVIEAFYGGPAGDAEARTKLLRRLATRWGGEKNADALHAAFTQLNEAIVLKQQGVPGFVSRFEGFGAVSSRFLTRPLLIKPDLLPQEDEAYFLPHIFNLYEDDARQDYAMFYGAKMKGPPTRDHPPLLKAFELAWGAARTFESTQGVREAAWFLQLALSLRMWVSEVRSINNFYFAQELRDRNAEKLNGPPRRPPRSGGTADPESWAWHEIQREEFDNTMALLGLLKNGGLDLIARAADARHEDTFLLGPDVIGAVQKKADLIRRHWRDADAYLIPGSKPP